MQWPKVSVIIPNYNYAHYLPQAIESVLAQTYPKVELIVVDDGSQDGSLELLDSYGERIRRIQQSNQGVSVARNRGVQESEGSLLAFLDADDYWLPTKLEKQVALFTADPELGLVHCGVEEFNESQGTLCVRQDGMAGWVGHELLLLQRAVVLGGGSGLMVRHTLFAEIGGFDQRLSTSADWDFFYRIASQRRIGFVPDVLVRYRVHENNMHFNVTTMEKDVLLGYRKAFAQATPELQQMYRQCYSNLHMMLAGSFFQAGNYSKSMYHTLKGLWFKPANSVRLFTYPLKRFQRRGTLHGGKE